MWLQKDMTKFYKKSIIPLQLNYKGEDYFVIVDKKHRILGYYLISNQSLYTDEKMLKEVVDEMIGEMK